LGLIMQATMSSDHTHPANTPIQDLEDRFEVILELLDALQALPNDVSEVKAVLTRMEHDNELCYTVLKEQGWLLKDQQARLKKLEAH
jgi:hypothetical protein